MDPAGLAQEPPCGRQRQHCKIRRAPSTIAQGVPSGVEGRPSRYKMIRCFTIVAIAMAALALPAPASAQAGDTYTARLGWVPTTPADRPNVIGKGSATATLAGRKLTIAGTFDGLA